MEGVYDNLKIVSYNVHGYNQGSYTVHDLSSKCSPDLFLLQELWLTASNMARIENDHSDYICFGSSASIKGEDTGYACGRPCGGIAILVKKQFLNRCHNLYSSERCVIIKIFNFIIVNVYLPCAGTINRCLLIDEVLNNIESVIEEFHDFTILIGGDLNCDLDGDSEAAKLVNAFSSKLSLSRCDLMFNRHCDTYVNTALNCSSCLDYFLINVDSCAVDYKVIDEGSNLSDHLPLVLECRNDWNNNNMKPSTSGSSGQKYLRWDHADTVKYYTLTGNNLQILLNELLLFETNLSSGTTDSYVRTFIESIYNRIVDVLQTASSVAVPSRSKSFYKFWWDQELRQLKESSINDHNLWKAAGRPRCGPIACKCRASKMQYKKAIRERQRREMGSQNQELYESLLRKNGEQFWRCWKSKFNSRSNHIVQVDGLTDSKDIAEKFIVYFSNCCSENTIDGKERFAAAYRIKRKNYQGQPFDDKYLFDVELVDSVIRDLGHGKASGIDGLSAEHLLYSHPALIVLLTKLFNLMMRFGYVPNDFGRSYIVPLPKHNLMGNFRNLSVDNFRCISIGCVVSKVLENCIYARYKSFFNTSDNQFGFKKGMSCSHAVYTVKKVVDYYVKQRATVNLCALDLTKAFDKMNHHGLFIKLMERAVPNRLLSIMEYWFNRCLTCVRWDNVHSEYVRFTCGVKQGGVLSPHLFAIFIDDVVRVINRFNCGCHVGMLNINIVLYADDILLIAPSISGLQKLLTLCETMLTELDMVLNLTKTVCMRIGVRYKDACSAITSLSGNPLSWVTCCRYLGVNLTAAKSFKMSLNASKEKYYRSANTILRKIGHLVSADVVIKLLCTKCVPILLYGTETCGNRTEISRILEFMAVRLCMKIFKTSSMETVAACQSKFPSLNFVDSFLRRSRQFLLRYHTSENAICAFLNDLSNEDSGARCSM